MSPAAGSSIPADDSVPAATDVEPRVRECVPPARIAPDGGGRLTPPTGAGHAAPVTLLDARTDALFARRLAAEAGEWLVKLRTRMGHDDPAALGAAGDRGAHDLIVAALARQRPQDAVLSEEGTDDAARLSAHRVWIVDPLDGTREFGEPGRDDWAVHIALWRRNTSAPFRLAAAAVALPARGVVLATQPPPPVAPRWASPRPRLVASRSRMPDFLPAVAEEIGADLVRVGSAGAKIAAVISGEADGYVHAGGQHEWDSAAPVAVAAAVGLHASRIDGSVLRYNQADTVLPDLLVCRTGLAPRLLAAIARHV